jgi:hypothetical protein
VADNDKHTDILLITAAKRFMTQAPCLIAKFSDLMSLCVEFTVFGSKLECLLMAKWKIQSLIFAIRAGAYISGAGYLY